MGNDFYDFYDTLIFALLRKKIFDKSRKIVKYAEKIVKNAWRYVRARVLLQQNSGEMDGVCVGASSVGVGGFWRAKNEGCGAKVGMKCAIIRFFVLSLPDNMCA